MPAAFARSYEIKIDVYWTRVNGGLPGEVSEKNEKKLIIKDLR